jgi:CRISPR-associated endonuclease/helicase Cas3
MPPTFDTFFQTATSGQAPYDYQRRLACGPDAKSDQLKTLTAGAPCTSQLISIPTGLGKTAAVVLAWLWNRIAHPDAAHRDTWPRRLVYCLPMRTLVEQTRDEIIRWLNNLDTHANALGLTPAAREQLAWLKTHSPVILMGGEENDDARREWDIHPERPAILIGTQDMLLSRALNRGYGMSRYRWPMHFGLLNNDCLWVMDETQLMGAGLSTACQLEAFRRSSPKIFGSFGTADSVTWYMSATSNPNLLKTREWREPRPDKFIFGLTEEEKTAASSDIHRRRNAVKRLEQKPDSSLGDTTAAKTLVAAILVEHEKMLTAIGGDTRLPARTLIICNTVDRAVALHQVLAEQKPDGRDLLLLHSRFRPPERKDQMKRLGSINRAEFPKGQIVISTQVIEAGVDVSSGVLCSEVAPLASLVQRLGRLNRAGEFNDSNWSPVAMLVGIKLPDNLQKRTAETAAQLEARKKEAAHLPYDYRHSEAAWTALGILNNNASPANLETIQAQIADSIPRCPYALQRHELLDFFDTDANLSLGYTDVSPFVRGLDEDTDIQVCWRESWPQEDGADGIEKPDFTPDFQRDELCSVPIGKALKARGILNRGWIWRGKQSGWISVSDAGLSPGMTVLLPLSAGGYDNVAGWTDNKDANKHASHYEPREELADEEQLSYLDNGWRSIAAHTEEVHDALVAILKHLLSGNEREHAALLGAVPWHDVGKNHADWQLAVVMALAQAEITGKNEHRPFAKFSLSESPSFRDLTGRELKREIARLKRMFRPGIAHEVASALAFRQAEQERLGPARDTDFVSLLSEYVIMSHHGHVRKVLRDEIPRFPSDAKDTETVRGISHRSPLPPVTINGQALGCDFLSTDSRKMGRDAVGHESYTRGVLRLLDHYGPFRLAYFEALFRAADIRASIAASGKSNA